MTEFIKYLGDEQLLLCAPLNFNADALFTVLVVAMIVFFSFARFIFGNHKPKAKRRLLKINSILLGVLLVTPFYLLGSSGFEKIIIGPAIFSIIFFNLRAIKVCDHCAHLNSSSSIRKPAQYCQNCGESLN